MPDLKRVTADLVESATSEVDPKRLRPKVEALLEAFDGAEAPARLTTVKTLGKALGKVDGAGAQVLALAIGALVEEGASAAAAWPSVSAGLARVVNEATRFADALVDEAAQEMDLEAAMEKAGPKVAAAMPKAAAAWKVLHARCLAAVACLARSKEARLAAREDPALAEATHELSEVIAEVGALRMALETLDDATIYVVAPKTSRGWKLVVDGVLSNTELYFLVAEAVGAKIDPKVLAAVRAGKTPKAKKVDLTFKLDIDAHQLAVDIPRRPRSNDRVLVMTPGKRSIEADRIPVLGGLAATARVEELDAATVKKLIPRSKRVAQ